MEALLLVQSHRAQGGTDGPSTRSEDRSCEQQLGILPNALREQWRKGARAPVPSQEVGYALDTSFWLIAVTSVPYPFRSQMAKVEHGEVPRIILPRTPVNSGPGMFSRRDARLRGARFYRVGA